MYNITVYCNHISKRSVHYNKYLQISTEDVQKINSKIEENGWTVKEEEVICDEHN